jgi:hypothetical protein
MVIWESWFPKGQDASAGDQWTVPEMWLSTCVGGGSRKDDTPPAEDAVLPNRDPNPLMNGLVLDISSQR